MVLTMMALVVTALLASMLRCAAVLPNSDRANLPLRSASQRPALPGRATALLHVTGKPQFSVQPCACVQGSHVYARRP